MKQRRILLCVPILCVWALLLLMPSRAVLAEGAAPVAPTPTPDAATPAPAPTPFSIIWIADTQTMAAHRASDAFTAMGRWIAENQESQNILYVLHTGDLVDSGDSPEQWEQANPMVNEFYGKVPFFPVAGNHDVGRSAHRYEGYLSQPFLQGIPEEQKYQDGKAAYATLNAGGTDFLFIGSGWALDDAGYDWLNGVIAAHPTHVCIIVTHMYLYKNGYPQYEGRRIQKKLVEPNPTVRLVIGGHVRSLQTYREHYDDDQDGKKEREVFSMLYNYQAMKYKDDGYFRIMTFDPADRSITCRNYSPYRDHTIRDALTRKQEWRIENAY